MILRNFDGAHRNSRTASTKHCNILKKIKSGQTWLVVSLAFIKSRRYVQAFPEQQNRSSNPGVGLCKALKIQVIESRRIFHMEDYYSSN